MTQEEIISLTKTLVEEAIASNPQHFLVSIKIKPTNNIKVFLDGDKGIGIDELVRYNRAVYKQLEEKTIFPEGDFSLEISSAGLDEPLKMHRQYVKNIGRNVDVTLLDGKTINGQLLGVTGEGIEVEETKGKGKKAEKVKHPLSFEQIKTTKIQIKF
ncbi:MAG: ribosome maturation factor [Niabella sp.]